jgi:heptosyltransferase-2
MTSTTRIAVIAPNWLGDAVMSLPLVGQLAAPDGVSVTVVAPELTARVYRGLDAVDELVVLTRRGTTRGVAARWRYLRAGRPEAVVILPPSFSGALGPALAGVKVRTGYATDGRGMLLTDPVGSAGARSRHLSDEFLLLGERALARLDIAVPETFEIPQVRVAGDDGEALDGLRADRGIPQRYAVLVPGATYGPAKSWPWRRYREVAVELSQDIPVVLAGTAPERELCGSIAAGNPRVFNLAGDTPIGTFLALLEQAAVVLANDSGSPHLAASLGTSVVVLFGSTSPEWTAPRGAAVDVVRFPVDCSPCFRKTCPTQLECFDGITTGLVLDRIRGLL